MKTRFLAFATILTLLLVLTTATSATAQTRYLVVVTNTTAHQILSPPVVVIHGARADLFQVGKPANAGVTAIAEDADAAPLLEALAASSEVHDAVVGLGAGGPLMPGASVVVEVTSPPGGFNRLSVIGMLVTTNDAFYGLDSYHLAGGPRSRSIEVPAYDAGSEANNESCDFIPGPPCGNPGVRATADAEGFIHVHPGISGVGDLDPANWDWKNPVAHIRIIRD